MFPKQALKKTYLVLWLYINLMHFLFLQNFELTKQSRTIVNFVRVLIILDLNQHSKYSDGCPQKYRY